MKKASILLITVFLHLNLFADKKSDLAEEILTLTKVEAIYSKLKEDAINETKSQATATTESLKKQFDMLPSEVLEQILHAADRFLVRATDSWSPKGVTQFQKELTIDFYSEDELAELVEFYKSPLGQKTVEAEQIFSGKLQKYIQEESASQMKIATEQYHSELRQIIVDFQNSLSEE